ncbi:phage antirepressor N-terminal domain-containing protein [Acinetobacter baumannii]
MSNLTYIPQVVSFHGTELFIVEHEGQPYVPMRSVVQGMGLDWASQFVKLKQIVNQVVMIFIITDFLVMCLK